MSTTRRRPSTTRRRWPRTSTATTIDVLANDTDPEGDAFIVDAVTQPANGTVAITNGGDDLTYQPDPDYCNTQTGGSPDTFTYTLDPGGATATVSVTVTCVDDPPVAVDDTTTVAEDAAATAVDVLANDTDVDGGPITIDTVTQPANGTVVITGSGTGVTYQPDPNYCNTQTGGSPDTFTYTLAPGGDTATVSVTVTCVDDPPIAVDDAATVVEDDPATAIGRVGQRHRCRRRADQHRLGDPAGQRDGGDHRRRDRPHLPTEPELLQHPTGTTLDTFTYTLAPGGSTATVTVTVTCVDDPPTAVDDTATVVEDDPATTIDVLANDTDPEGDAFIVDAVTQPANGTVAITNGGDDLTYQPDADYCNTQTGGSPRHVHLHARPGRLDRHRERDGDLCRRPAGGGRRRDHGRRGQRRRRRSTCWPTTPTSTAAR